MAKNKNKTVNNELKKALENTSTDILNDAENNAAMIEDDEFDNLLKSFINSEDDEDDDFNHTDLPDESSNTSKKITAPQSVRREISKLDLGNDENELAQAYANFLDAISTIAETSGQELPEFFFVAENLIPNYKPSTGRKIVADAMLCWDILFKAYPEKLSSLNPSASDEEFLNFAESLSDQNLQLAIISYVEILIDIENCEITYEERRLKAQRRRIERQLYEEYMHRQETRQKFIQAISVKAFPINAERLITNYLKNATKDAEGAYQALVKNPAVYAPIEINKIKPRFFGLIKPSSKDGIRENHRIGEFLKKLKV